MYGIVSKTYQTKHNQISFIVWLNEGADGEHS